MTMRPVVSAAQSMQYLESQADCNWVHDKSEQTQPAELTIVSKENHTRRQVDLSSVANVTRDMYFVSVFTTYS